MLNFLFLTKRIIHAKIIKTEVKRNHYLKSVMKEVVYKMISEQKPELNIIGVYAIPEEQEVKLIEIVINCPPSKIDAGMFTQPEYDIPKSSWQVAYDEHFLNVDGTEIIGRYGDNEILDGIPFTRIAFFLYFVDFDKPLLSQFGEHQLPVESPIPDRLKNIIVFELPD